MNMKNFTLGANQVFGGEYAILTGQAPLKEYKDGKATDNVIGMKFSVSAFKNNFENVTVKVEGAKALDISDEEILQANATLQPIFVTLEGFQGKPYANNGGMQVSCSAKAVKIVPREEVMSDVDIFGGEI